MLFNSTEFIVVFLPLVLVAFHASPPRFRLWILCLSSLFFYGVAGIVPLAFMCAGIAWAFAAAWLSAGTRRSWAPWLAVSFPLWVLFMFRYLDFTLDSMAADDDQRRYFSFFLGVVLPAGISFYTFQIVSYSIDVHGGRIARETSLLRLATYISLFPQLIAGPIVRYEQMRDQLARIATEKRLDADFAGGLKFIAIGLFAKIFVADMAYLPRQRFQMADNTSSLDALLTVFAYSFQIYYDFWAYSLTAIGLAKLFSIELPINFREPYVALNPQDFWRRWHITLSYWLRDYVYLRLGGNKRYIRNILIVFAACGLWHGAGWNFVLWGLLHAGFVLFYRFNRFWWDRMPNAVQIAMTFIVVSLAWPLFYLDLPGYLVLLDQIFVTGEWRPHAFGVKHWGFIAVVAAWTFFARESMWLYNDTARTPLDWPAVQAVALFGAVIFFSWGQTFIYFRF